MFVSAGSSLNSGMDRLLPEGELEINCNKVSQQLSSVVRFCSLCGSEYITVLYLIRVRDKFRTSF
jgi:hypothetical protein